MFMQMGGWCLITSGAKVLVYMVALTIVMESQGYPSNRGS